MFSQMGAGPDLAWPLSNSRPIHLTKDQMMTNTKPEAGGLLPQLTFNKLGGGTLQVGGTRDQYTLFMVYRGKHCGRCKKYLNGLETQAADWEAAVSYTHLTLPTIYSV